MGDLFDGYPLAGSWDEMFATADEARPHYRPLQDLVGTLSSADFDTRCVARDRGFRDQGITFALSGEERPFPLDLIPRIIPADKWEIIDRGCASTGADHRGLPRRPRAARRCTAPGVTCPACSRG